MKPLFVVNHRSELPGEIPGIDIVTARAYLSDKAYAEHSNTKVVNLCRTLRYQSRGYYVSLLAEARGHVPLPDVKAIEDLRQNLAAVVCAELDGQIQEALASIREPSFDLDAYFGRDPAQRNDALARALFRLLKIPMMRARFSRCGEGWRIDDVRPLGLSDIEPSRLQQVIDNALDYLGSGGAKARRARAKPSLAILCSDDEPDPPSNPDAIRKFQEAGERVGMSVETVTHEDIDRLAHFDALFIRDTTRLNHYTYQFARRAAAEGMPVLDSPDSILKCNNKVFLSELLAQHQVPTPKTVMVHRGNMDTVGEELGFPCILKQPDSAFSLGVYKIECEEALRSALVTLLAKSDLVIAQQWLPTDFDWRVGILERRPLYVCKYFMAPGHWQVIKRESHRRVEGGTAAIAVSEAPSSVVDAALRAANLIGDGLYGVDVKQTNGHCYVIEVNDNPNVDAGNEDGVLGDALYREIMGMFVRRITERGRESTA